MSKASGWCKKIKMFVKTLGAGGKFTEKWLAHETSETASDTEKPVIL